MLRDYFFLISHITCRMCRLLQKYSVGIIIIITVIVLSRVCEKEKKAEMMLKNKRPCALDEKNQRNVSIERKREKNANRIFFPYSFHNDWSAVLYVECIFVVDAIRAYISTKIFLPRPKCHKQQCNWIKVREKFVIHSECCECDQNGSADALLHTMQP